MKYSHGQAGVKAAYRAGPLPCEDGREREGEESVLALRAQGPGLRVEAPGVQ